MSGKMGAYGLFTLTSNGPGHFDILLRHFVKTATQKHNIHGRNVCLHKFLQKFGKDRCSSFWDYCV